MSGGWKTLGHSEPCVVSYARNVRFRFFLSETRLDVSMVNNIRVNLGFDGGFGADKNGLDRGLILLWKDSVEVMIRSYTKGLIDYIIVDNEVLQWRFTGFYDEPRQGRRNLSWTLLKGLRGLSSLL
ncbi:hypothetical protein ACOSQ3_021179 [Xanthoceras sorbifolium]